MPVTSAAKLASHLWRGAAQSAANAAHNSANTFRGAFQGASTGTSSSTSSSASSSASGWASGLSSGGGSSAGAGVGGAKFQAGRGAHYTYQHSSRALSQASSTTSNDANSKSNDDEEEARMQKAYKLHLKSQSRHERGGLPHGSATKLSTSQMQARFRHALATHHGSSPLLVTDAAQPPGPAHVRSAHTLAASEHHAHSTAPDDEAALQSQTRSSSELRSQSSNTSAADLLYQQLQRAIKRRDATTIRAGVDAFQALAQPDQTASGFNIVMEALLSIRSEGQPIREILDVYYQMVEGGHSPNSRTFSVLVKALCARDAELHRGTAAVDPIRVDEDNFGKALELMGVAHSSRIWFNDEKAYNAILSSCALRGDVDSALGVLNLLERCLFAHTDAQTFKHLIRTFVLDPNVKPDESRAMQDSRKLAACKQVFDEFLLASQQPEWKHDDDAVVWSSLIDAHFALGDPAGAVTLFEKLLEGGDAVPALKPVVINAMIRGFLNAGDTVTALHWFSKVSAQGFTKSLPLPHSDTTEMLIAALSGSEQHLSALQGVFHAYLQQQQSKLGRASSPKLAVASQVVGVNAKVASASMNGAGADSGAHAQSAMDRGLEALAAFFGHTNVQLSSIDPYDQVGDTIDMISSVYSLTDALISAGRIVDAGSCLTYAAPFVERIDLVATPFAEAGFADQLSQLGRRFFAMSDHTIPPCSTATASLHLFASAEYVAPLLRSAQLLDESFAAGLSNLYRSCLRETSRANTAALPPLSNDGWRMVLDAFCFEEEHVRPLDLAAFEKDGIPLLLESLETAMSSSSSAEAEDVVQAGQLVRSALDFGRTTALTESRYGREGLQLLPAWACATESQSAAVAFADSAEAASAPASATEADMASSLSTPPTTPATTPAHQHSPLHRTDLPLAPSTASAPVFAFPPVQVIDTDFGHVLTSLAHPSGQHDAPRLYEQVLEQMRVGNFAHPEGLAVLISAFGRLGNAARVEELYAMSQHVLHALVGDPVWQRSAWFVVEDGMIQALSHAGLPEAATVHRHRIIAAGGTPTSTAYASLIATIRDTTDDASIAEELFDESQRLGVRPSAFLFNTVISKLSRARKTERALQLFDEMTLNFRIKPTSVTYGAVINACTRIGDEERAVRLFERMESDPAFKPRVPPYNTMMQFYIQSMPDRNKALVYLGKMQAAGVRPSAHTYKLLLDLHGAVEPVEADQMAAVFDQLVSDPSVAVQGTHWASLINCHGCLLNDLDRAVAIFDSIAEHPSSRAAPNPTGASSPLPDAVAFEALLAVFVAHHRVDLIRPHLERMKQSGIKLTAYVANLLIRGFAMEGEGGIYEARALFESMSEPAAGVAAVGNHPPRAPGAGALAAFDNTSAVSQTASATGAPPSGVGSPFGGVQREPSTYEAMIRAELALGNREQALVLVERMEARAFPPALVIRARSLIAEGLSAYEQRINASAAPEPGSLTQFVPISYTFGKTSPRVRSASLFGAATAPPAFVAASPGSVRHASTMASRDGEAGTSNPAPGPPKPNSPFTIFDRNVKTLQKDRAATRPALTTAADGSHAFGDATTRGEVSRQTDYVRKAIAESLADRVLDIKRDFETIVELGAGPGYLRHYLDATGTGTRKIIMCDTSEELLNRDRHLDDKFGFEFERRIVDEESLPFEEGSLDCVVVSGGLHWTNDLPGALIQIRRALKPDGVCIAGLCGGDTLFELRTSLQLAEQEREGGISPRISPMADTRDMASLLSRAGFTIPTVDVDEVTIGYPSMYELMHDLRDMGESNAVINRRGMLRRDTMLAAGAIYQSLHGMAKGDGDSTVVDGAPEDAEGVPATFSLIFLIGWAPSPTQPKPLKRGSAKASLKDVLMGEEGDAQAGRA
ncbi:hypothetical protein BCV70DRAFT_222893 [Testicularia cyperi]|uniref:Methyltransferase type 11 domain-containing protein n=1 Tax=Testicularia cyperi TaxID=1882483 RepID=A0A317XSQ9_9BASI|nr:hypothetical protein BCV70DRAFT_222893 [Testicularia cyperi]